MPKSNDEDESDGDEEDEDDGNDEDKLDASAVLWSILVAGVHWMHWQEEGLPAAQKSAAHEACHCALASIN